MFGEVVAAQRCQLVAGSALPGLDDFDECLHFGAGPCRDSADALSAALPRSADFDVLPTPQVQAEPIVFDLQGYLAKIDSLTPIVPEYDYDPSGQCLYRTP
jgi:hypothetical protein